MEATARSMAAVTAGMSSVRTQYDREVIATVHRCRSGAASCGRMDSSAGNMSKRWMAGGVITSAIDISWLIWIQGNVEIGYMRIGCKLCYYDPLSLASNRHPPDLPNNSYRISQLPFKTGKNISL